MEQPEAAKPQNKRSKKAESVPDYFSGRGTITVDSLKKKFETDLINNLPLAEKMGVFNVLHDMQQDAKQKMQLLEQRRKRADQDQPQFPGYEERLEEVQKEIRHEVQQKLQREAQNQADVIGEVRAGFHLGKDSKVDLQAIYETFKQEGLRSFSEAQFNALLSQSEVMAFMTQLHMDKARAISRQEANLINYIKYLVGESNNGDFEFKREDFSQKHELNTQSLKTAFDEYARQENDSMKTVANDIIERVDYRTVVKHESEPISIVKYESNPKFYYFQICKKDSDLAIPLLAKVVNRQLSLMSYQLSIGHVRAFVRTFDFNNEFVNRFLFKNCGMSDQHIEILLQRCEQLKQVVSLVFKHEEFGLRSMQALKPLLTRPKPNELQVLRIIDCRIPGAATRELVSTLNAENHLRVLGLVNTKICDSSMQEIAQLVSKSRSLRDLDISWNLLKPQSYRNLLSSLGENRLLLSLNLSWNTLVDSKEHLVGSATPGPRKRASKTQTQGTSALSVNSIDESKPWYDHEVRFSEMSQQVVQCLCSLIKRNKRLLHVNLTGTGLSEMMMVHVANAVARAKSLVSIHLCSNPGTTLRVKKYVAKRIRAMPHRDQVSFSFQEVLNSVQNHQTLNILQRQLNVGAESVGEKPVARETIKIKQNMERKRIFSLVNDFAIDGNEDSRLILTRILGHKMDMPGSGQWKVIKDKSEECWICDQQIYGLVFWDADHIAEKAVMSTKKPHQEEPLRKAIERMRAVVPKEDEDRVADANPRSPIIMGDFTNWQPKPFLDIADYCETLQPQFDKEQLIQRMHFDKVLPYRKSELHEFDEKDHANYGKYVCNFFETWAPDSWKQVLQKRLLYKKPHLVNAIDTRSDFYHSLFLIAAMFRVGKHEFIVREPRETYDRTSHAYCQQGEPHYMYFTDISDIRPEEVHPFSKTAVTNKIIRRFNKEKSVFHPWKGLSAQQTAQAFECDLEKNKITKIIRNAEDLERTIQILSDNYQYLTECYLELQYNSVYPFINKIELANFCEKAKLIGENLNQAHCDLLFVSSNEVKKGGIKQKTGLIRCEFIEYLVRVAAFKFVSNGNIKTYNEALQIVICDYMKPNFKPMPWQRFRDEELWTLEVNDVFETNLEGVQKLHGFYFTPTQRFFSATDAINLFTKDTKLELTYKQANYCLSFCKMPMKDELADFEKYNKLQPVELMEMMGRAAKIKYQNTEYEDEPLERRIEIVMDMLFPLVGFRRREVAHVSESESQSDSDY